MKKLLIGIGAIIVLLVIAGLVAPFLIPTDTYRAQLISLVKQATGRDLTIAGAVKLSFLPQIEVEANDVALSNAPGASTPDMLRLKQLQVQLRFLPLLHGAVELGRFVLDQPEISLEVDKNGRPNWVFVPTAAAPAAPAPSAPSAPQAAPAAAGNPAAALSALRLEDVRLEHGKINYRDDRAGTSQEVDDINVKLALTGPDTPLNVDGSATWNDQQIALTVGVNKFGALFTGKETGFQVKLAGQPVNLSFVGNMTGLPPAKLDGTIDLAVPSVRGLAKWVGAALPPGGGLGRLSIKGKIDMAGLKIAFTDAAIAIDAISAQGSVAVDTSGARPYVKGTLAVDKLDVNPYLPPQTDAAAAQPAAAPSGGGAATPAAGWSDAPIDVSALGLADADFDLKTGSILYRKIVVGPSAIAVNLKGGKLTLNLSQLSLYQGQGQGKIALDGSGATPSLALSFALSGLQIEPLLVAAAGSDRLTGTGKLSLDVTGTGKSQRALINALNGKGALDLTNGQLKGVNLITMAENVASPLTGKSSDNTTDFGSLTGTYTITNGVAHNDDLQLKSGIIPITGAGTVNLPDRSIEYRVTVSLAGAIGVPVLISGPWNDISYKPDLAGMLQGAAQKPGQILNQLRTLGTAGAGAGASAGGAAVDKLKSLFGK